MIVVDASALLEVLLRTPAAQTIEAHLLGATSGLHAPHLLDVEVAQVIRRHVAHGYVSADRARASLDELRGMPLTRYPHVALLPRVWELRHNLSAYDATYVALAEALDAPLLTRDRRVAAAIGHHAQVELV
ncbi:MAG TPA: type II toxin-antitoxin system VapC family toxin [Caulobacteraceae bacterium]